MGADAAVLDRLADKFTVDDGCWEWTAAKGRTGYGRFLYKGSVRLAHGVMWDLFNGPLPEGTELDHLCRNRGCVRPSHLEPVTHRDNLMRAPRWQVMHCPRGHAYDETNTYRVGNHRRCRACHRDRGR
jgi:hypothetical protein